MKGHKWKEIFSGMLNFEIGLTVVEYHQFWHSIKRFTAIYRESVNFTGAGVWWQKASHNDSFPTVCMTLKSDQRLRRTPNFDGHFVHPYSRWPVERVLALARTVISDIRYSLIGDTNKGDNRYQCKSTTLMPASDKSDRRKLYSIDISQAAGLCLHSLEQDHKFQAMNKHFLSKV